MNKARRNSPEFLDQDNIFYVLNNNLKTAWATEF